MDKKLILAVAGSGKTTKILNSLREGRRSLIITYTIENLRSIEAALIDCYGRVPDNIELKSYFSFLYTFCVRPYFSYKLRDNSFTWNQPDYGPSAPGKTHARHYITRGRYLYANRAAKLILECDGINRVRHRVEKYFDSIFIDEVQDFAANDFNLLLELSRANVDVMFVGDYYQHTFDTSRDGQIRKNLHKKGIEAYVGEFRNHGIDVDTATLSKSYRCTPAVCDFISNVVGIPIQSHRTDASEVVVVDDRDLAHDLFRDDNMVKLFYQEARKYSCYANNWGKSKGLNKYGDVCVVLNTTTAKCLRKGELSSLAEPTRNKLYVACSRARGSLYIVDEAHVKHLKGVS